MNKKSANPLDSMSFNMPKLDELESAQANDSLDPKTNSKAGRPPKKRETRQRNLLLPVEQLKWLDEVTTEARGEKAFRQNAIVVAIFDVVMKSKLSLRGVKDEKEIQARVESAIKSKQ